MNCNQDSVSTLARTLHPCQHFLPFLSVCTLQTILYHKFNQICFFYQRFPQSSVVQRDMEPWRIGGNIAPLTCTAAPGNKANRLIEERL